jgi:raffinose/stachyose/melibiose transport system permease protein
MINKKRWWVDALAIIVGSFVFVIPFLFMLMQATKTQQEAYQFKFNFGKNFLLWQNIKQVVSINNHIVIRAFINSICVTLISVTFVIFLTSMAAFVLSRRPGKLSNFANLVVLAGLIVPPAIVPTIWVLQRIHLFKTLPGLVFIEIAYSASFSILIYRAFISSIPREIDEAAAVDGCTGFSLFRKIIFPLLMPVNATILITTSVAIFNDFTNPLYFTPGDQNATVQLTLYNFNSQYLSQYHLLFTDILLITIPPLILFAVFNKKIVAGMTTGSVKG